MPMDLSVDFHFCAAHRLPYYDGPCFRMHGHNYKLQVVVTGKPNPRDGMIIDFEEIRKKTWELALNQCDHHTLNDFLDNPTAENVIVHLEDYATHKVITNYTSSPGSGSAKVAFAQYGGTLVPKPHIP